MENAALIAERTNPDTQMIMPATVSSDGREVYIISGNVVMLDDGSGVDVGNSDESVVVMDASTGKVEMVSPRYVASVDAGVAAEDMKSAVERNTVAAISQSAADVIDGQGVAADGIFA